MGSQYFMRGIKCVKQHFYWLIVGLVVGFGIGVTGTFAAANPISPLLPTDQETMPGYLLNQRSNNLKQNMTVDNNSLTVDTKTNADGYLSYKWGSCPLSLDNGTLTIHAGTLASIMYQTDNDAYKLLQSDQVTAINVGDGVKFPEPSKDDPNENAGLIFSVAQNVTSMHISKGVIFPTDSSGLFALIPRLSSITFDQGINTSNVTNMSWMFELDPELKSLDLSAFNTKNVTNMNQMFCENIVGDPSLGQHYDNKLTTITFGPNFDTKNVKDMAWMFFGATDLKTLNNMNFNTSNVITMAGMFCDDESLTSLDVHSFDVSKVTSFADNLMGNWYGMFSYDKSLKSLGLSNFHTDSAINMFGMFFQDSSLESVNLSNFNTKNVVLTAMMFAGDKSLKSLDLSNFDTREAMKNSDYGGTMGMLGMAGDYTITDVSGNKIDQSYNALLSSLWRIKVGPNTVISASVPSEPKITLGLPAAPIDHQFVDLDFPGATFDNNGPDWQLAGTNSDGHSNLTDTLKNNTELNQHFADTNRSTTETWVWQQVPSVKQTISLKYVDQNGKSIANSQTISGYPGTSYDVSGDNYQLAISGYTFNKVVGNLIGKFGTEPITITFEYRSNSNSGGGSGNQPGSSSSTDNTTVVPTPPSSSSSNSSTSSNSSASTNDNDVNNVPNYAAAKGTVVYSINKIGLYKKTNFSNNNRRSWYAKKPRINRPMFVVTGYARSTNGNLRYQVRDVNHSSKTDGQKGYITASRKYVRPVYYATKHSTVTVINPRGVNAYRKADLTGKVKNYRQGTVLRVKGIVKHNLTTRYVLTNGQYVTANRKLVNMGRHKQVKSIKTKRAINRYSNVNFTKKNQSIAKNRTLKVYGYDYSQGHDVSKHGTLRYRVAGGYITANTKYVRAYK